MQSRPRSQSFLIKRFDLTAEYSFAFLVKRHGNVENIIDESWLPIAGIGGPGTSEHKDNHQPKHARH